MCSLQQNLENMRILIISILLILLTSCKDKDRGTKPASSNGLWQQLGYGKVIEIKNDSVKILDISKVGCNVYDKVLLSEIGKIDTFSQDSLTIKKNIKSYKYVRLEELPTLCNQPNINSKNPVYNFDVLWNTFDEHYCYFETRNIDWDLIYQNYRSKITSQTNEIELYQILDEMLSSLNDGHVSMDVPDHLVDTIQKIRASQQVNSATNERELSTYHLGIKAQSNIAEYYCNELKYHNGGIARWGIMKDEIGYIQINAMLFLAYYDLPKDLSSVEELWPHYWAIGEERTYQRQDEIDGAGRLMDSVLNDLKDAKVIVLDLRFNVGGKDEVALEIIGRFVNQRKIVARKKARLGQGFTNHQAVFIVPQSPNYLEKVYVLTSHLTSSAAEIAGLATIPYDNLVRIGSNTDGTFSDGLDKRLPNGWEYTLSNEVYEDVDGNNYESIGIPPDIDLNYSKDERAFYNMLIRQISGDGDEAIERVFEFQKRK